MTVTDYTVVTARKAEELAEKVRSLMKQEGWQPLGGVCWDYKGGCWAQAMIMYFKDGFTNDLRGAS